MTVYPVKYLRKKAMLFGHPEDDMAVKHWSKGRFYESRKGELLDVLAGQKFKHFVDIGAHWGNHSAFFNAKQTTCFEPCFENFVVLERNLELNLKQGTYNAYHMALGAETGTAGLETPDPNNSGNTKLAPGNDTKIRSLDSFKLKPDYIKIDVEGAEIPVLFGAMHTIMAHRPIVSVEVSCELEVNDFMENMGYRVEGTKNPTKTNLYYP
jgi:FkbM family methyltransferase